MKIEQFVWEPVDSNSWLIVERNMGLLIDVIDSDDLFSAVADLETLTVILTHSHFDHIVGINRLRELKPDITVLSTAQCSDNIGNKFRNMSSTADAFLTFYHQGEKRDCKIEPFICEPATKTFETQDIFEWCGHSIKLTPVYGHSNDGLIAVVDGMLLFSGDTLLSVPTATRFPSGNSKRFWFEDMPMLQGLKNIECVYPGHGQPRKLEEMLEINKMPKRYREI